MKALTDKKQHQTEPEFRTKQGEQQTNKVERLNYFMKMLTREKYGVSKL